ncbi:MFS-type transporter SLC18B1-like [Mya arenaria]|uniref:MFS-type transporter SLC18B1-like n=1 Tax=Mya arenaria TaxID=6604 RepID=UPI0022DF5951|nr:MFS-type transporter SLC18B1-like [Mya arenaria]
MEHHSQDTTNQSPLTLPRNSSTNYGALSGSTVLDIANDDGVEHMNVIHDESGRDSDYRSWSSPSSDSSNETGSTNQIKGVSGDNYCGLNGVTVDLTAGNSSQENGVSFRTSNPKISNEDTKHDNLVSIKPLTENTKSNVNKVNYKPLNDSYDKSLEYLSQYMSNKNAPWPLAEGSVELPNNSLSDSNSPNFRPKSRESIYSPTHENDTVNTNADGGKSDDGDDEEEEEEEEEEDTSLNLRKLTRNQYIVLVCTCFTNLLCFLSLSILAPFFPLEADKKGVSTTVSGWIFGIYALVQFLTSPFFGRLMPIIGSRFMFLAGLFICGGCTLLFGVLDRVDVSGGTDMFVAYCFVTRVLLALGGTAVTNAGFVIMIKAFPDNIATVFGIGEVFTGIGMIGGPALGGLLYTAGGFLMPFAVVGGATFLCLPIALCLLPHQYDITDAEEDDMSIRKLLFSPRSIVNSIVIVIGASVWSILDPTLEPHLRVYGLGPEMVGVLFLIMAALYSVTSPLWGRLADHVPDNRVILVPGLILCAVGLLLAGPSPLLGFALSYNKIWMTILSLVILGVGSSMCIIPTYDIYIDIVDDLGYPNSTRTYGMVSGLWVSMYALGDFIGPSAGGFGFEQIGFEWLMTVVATACVLCAILVLVTWLVERKCVRKVDKITIIEVDDVTEKTPLLSTADSDDVMRSYPPGSVFNGSSSV